MHDILAELGLTPEQIPYLGGNERSRLLNFLLRWQQFETLSRCLDVLIALQPDLVSLLDLRVQLLLALDQPQEALRVMQERLRRKSSFTARTLLARVYLSAGDAAAAHQIARELVQERPDSPLSWALLGEVELARRDTQAALDAYQHMRALNPDGRAYLAGMLSLYQAQQNWVIASGYAAQLRRSADEEHPLPATYLRRLRDYFQASGETTNAAEIEAALERLYETEWQELRAALPATGRPRPALRQPLTPQAAAPEPSPAESLPTIDQIPISGGERAAIAQAVQQHFGFGTLLPGQAATMACVQRGEDVLTILPTGGGKSLCYQLPALLAEQGTTLVISPLIALMKDQVDSLPDRLRRVTTAINSSLDGDELRSRLRQIAQGKYRLVYAAPERLRQPTFTHALRRAGLARIVIDEAHCISVWGHDFRPDYLTVGEARHALGDPPVLALTATAPPQVRKDILAHLESGAEREVRLVAGDITRPNLRLEVFYANNADEKLAHLVAFCKTEATNNPTGSGIVYAGTRARCEELAALLRQYGVSAAHYHAGITNRDRVQDDFMAGRVQVVVATIAFGLGIDKPDIRFIVHYAPPPSLASYYQEAGRAGRDGQPARCLLMVAPSDRGILTRQVHRNAMPVDFLRRVYGAVKRRLNGASYGRVAAGDLERDLGAEDTRVRVALSLLQEAGLLRRGPDLPRTASVCLEVDEPAAAGAELASFCQTAHLRPHQWLDIDLVAVCRQAALPPFEIERKILEWEGQGRVSYRPAGRDLLLELLPPPQDATQRIELLLERQTNIQIEHVDEIAAYAVTTRCRHGYLNAYLGGRMIERCAACDNCIGAASPPPDVGLPDEREQLLLILRSVSQADWSWGKRSMERILCGDSGRRKVSHPLSDSAREHPGFGKLAFRTPTQIGRLLDWLEQGGFLQARRLDRGGAVLKLTPQGQAALNDPTLLDALVGASTRPPARSSIATGSNQDLSRAGIDVPASAKSQDTSWPRPPRANAQPAEEKKETEPAVDASLFEALRAWRLEQARAHQVAPFMILHDRVLRAIAAHRPTTLPALSEVKGIGPAKLERYGAQIVEVVTTHLKTG